MFKFRQKQKAMENCQNKVCSDGSFEILDIEEVEFQGSPTDLLGCHVMEKFKLMSRENSSEDYIMVVRSDSLTNSSIRSACDSLSTLTMSSEGCPSVAASVGSSVDGWDRQERAPPPSDPPHSPGQSWANPTGASGESRESQTESCGDDDKDGVLEHCKKSCTKTYNTKTFHNGVTNLENSFCFDRRPVISNTFPRPSQTHSSGHYYSSNAQASLRLTKSNSPIGPPGEKPACASSGHKKRSAHSEGSNSLVGHGGCKGAGSGHAMMYLKKKSAHDVCRAISEPNEKDLLDSAQLLALEHPKEWLLKLSGQPQCVVGQHPANSCEASYPSSEWQQDRSPPTEEAIRKCIEKHSADFLQYTNWKCLFPYLVSNELLDRCAMEILINDMITSTDKGIKFYYEVLPSKGKTAYSRYYRSVSQERDHIGHQTLIEILDEFGSRF